MWEEMVECIRKSAKDMLGISRGGWRYDKKSLVLE